MSSKEYNRSWELSHREERNEYRKKYNLLNRERISELRKIRYQKDKENQQEKNRTRNRRYYASHKEKIFEYHYKRIAQDDLYRFRVRLRHRLYKFLRLRGFGKKCKFNEYVGCSPGELKTYIEEQFTVGMNWSNYGKWHIDHRIPLTVARTEEEVYKLMHFSNLQPMWAADNIRKSNKLTKI